MAAAAETPVVAADALAQVAFTRSPVETTSNDGRGQISVASAGLSRPPAGSLMAPLESLHESSPFGLRTNPLTGAAGELHWGQDYAAACGARVYSADAGVVRAVGWHPWGGGNRVEIDHGNGLITTYNHLEGIAVRKGDSVRVGEVIARVGTTGSSTGCHLHFETILNGSHVDPLRYRLLPVRKADRPGPVTMTSYAPEAGKTSNAKLGWAVPGGSGHQHGGAGAQERPVAAPSASKRAPKPAAPESPAGKSPAGKSPSATPSPDGKAPAGKSPAGKPPAGKSPDGKPPVGKSPDGKSPDGKSPDGKSPAGKSPSATPSPAGKAPAGKAPAGKSPSVTPSPAGKAPAGKAATGPSSMDSPPATARSGQPQTEPALSSIPAAPSEPDTSKPKP